MADKTLEEKSRDLCFIFGGQKPWDMSCWTSSDDRVRGGKSQSYIQCHPPNGAEFYGWLDTTALGGAGFASQRTIGDRIWDFSPYAGLVIEGEGNDDKTYTFILKDTVLEKRPDGREQSTINWEYDFVCRGRHQLVAEWADFKPTYRGKPKLDAPPLDRANIKRMSLMTRSFFGQQEGRFSLVLGFVAAYGHLPQTPFGPLGEGG